MQSGQRPHQQFPVSPAGAQTQQLQGQIRSPDAVGDVAQPYEGGGFWGKVGGGLKKFGKAALKTAPIWGSLAAAPFTGGASLFGLGAGASAGIGGAIKAALPSVIAGVGGALAGKAAQKSAMKRSPEEQKALSGAQTAAGTLQQTGGELVTEGRQTLQQPTSYWQRLLGGNRPLMAQATAGARGGITDIYRGAERGLEKSGVRGASRDTAKAELNRQRASQIAGLTTGVQPFAAQQLAGIGGGLLSEGTPMLGEGGRLYSDLLGQGTENRKYGRQEGEKFGSSAGGLIFDIMSGTIGSGGGGGGKKSPLPSRAPWGNQYPMTQAPSL